MGGTSKKKIKQGLPNTPINKIGRNSERGMVSRHENRRNRQGRAFGGKTEGFEDSVERNFEKLHLKTYLKGRPFFNHGYEGKPFNRFRTQHTVKINKL